MFKVSNKDTRRPFMKTVKALNTFIKPLEASHGVVLVPLLLTLNIFSTPCSSVSIVNFEQVNASWGFS